VVLACSLFIVTWGFLHVGVFQREYAQSAGDDLGIYRGYGEAVTDGALPYRDFPVVYPPGALPAFVVPVVSSDYGKSFGFAMLLCGLVMVILVALEAPSGLGLVFAGMLPLLVGDLTRTRYDLWPVCLTTAALFALLRDRHRLGWALLGGAVAAKGYTVCLVPLAAVWTARRAGIEVLRRSAAWGAGVAAALLVPFVVLAPGGVWASFRDQIVRPLQIESLGGAMLMAAKRAEVVGSYGSNNIAGGSAQVLSLASGVLLVGALIACWVRFARGATDPERFCMYAAASVTAFVAFGKVLSPQYLIWLVPLVALVRGRRGAAAVVLLTAACLLTLWWTPTRYGEYKNEFRWAWVVLARDVVLVVLFAVLVSGRNAVFRRRPRPV